ncbi:MAG: metallophosphoesterase [Nannocystaceae bacterium]
MEREEIHDLIVVSDLHIGRGKNPATGRYFELETFFYDADFLAFCQYLCAEARDRGRPFKLLLNGDAFDLLRLDRVPTAEKTSRRERRYGPAMTPEQAAAAIREILCGHPEFVDGLAQVLAAGYEVIFLPGNHDLEIQWPAVHAEIRAALLDRVAQLAGEASRGLADGLLRFRSWFYYEPGRVWIEHGCQYDPENAFRFNLRAKLEDEEASLVAYEEDMPLGNFFQRYLYNAFGHITFIVPSTRANFRYFKWLIVHQPRLLGRAVASHGRFWWQVMRRLTTTSARAREQLRERHEEELRELAEESGLGDDLRAIDGLKRVRGDITTTVRALGWQILKDVAFALLIGLTIAGLWFAGFHAINQLQGGFVIKASLFLVLDFVFLLFAIAFLGYALLRPSHEPAARPLRRAARKIARRLKVPLVCFGHTHEEVLWRNSRGAAPSWYLNSGTWIAVFTHDVFLPRDRVQYSFVRIEGDEGTLLHWSPGRGKALPVILLDEHEAEGPPRRPR